MTALKEEKLDILDLRVPRTDDSLLTESGIFPALNRRFDEEIQAASGIGHGVLLRSLFDEDPAQYLSLSSQVTPPNYPESRVLLAPPGGTKHPLAEDAPTQTGPQPMSPLRGHIAYRSFHYRLPGHDGESVFSFVVKGDLNLPILDKMDKNILSAIFESGRVPAIATRRETLEDFNNARLLHSFARTDGRSLPPLPYPLRVQTIESIEDCAGATRSLRDTLNGCSDRMLSLNTRSLLGIRAREALGDWLLDRRKEVPCQYTYIIKGADLRVSEAVESLIFTADNPFDLMGLQAEPAGDDLARAKIPPQDAVRRLYFQLGREYGIDLSPIIPSENRLTPRQMADLIRSRLNEYEYESANGTSRVSDCLMQRFLDNILYVAALAHQNGCTLTHRDSVYCQGALAPRNCTIGGVVLDVNSLKPIAGRDDPRIALDLNSAAASACFMRCLLYPGRAPHVFKMFRSIYDRAYNAIEPQQSGAAANFNKRSTYFSVLRDSF